MIENEGNCVLSLIALKIRKNLAEVHSVSAVLFLSQTLLIKLDLPQAAQLGIYSLHI